MLTMLPLVTISVLLKIATAILDPTELPVEKKELFAPPLEEIAQVLNNGLGHYYHEVQAEVVDCPDLRQPPFTLANSGLNGDPQILSIGDVRYLFPYANLSKVYDLRHLLQIMDKDSAFFLGASSGPFLYAGTNCESVVNINIMNDKIDQQSLIIKIRDDGSFFIEKLPNNETRFDILADYFSSRGEPGPVLKVRVKRRISEKSFSVSIREVLTKYYGDKIIGLGGTFILEQGYASQTLVPEFSKTPFHTFDDVRQWLRYYNMPAPLIGVGMLVTGTYDLDLRLQHFHTFSYHGDAGHYNSDVTPELAEYVGYFNTAKHVYRIDKPPSTNPFVITRKGNE